MTPPAAAGANTPSMTTQWKCRWTLRLEPKVFCGNVLQDRFVQAQLGDQLLEPCILVLQLLQFPHLVRLHPGVLLLKR